MIDKDRSNFDQALDSLAKVLRVTPLDSEIKFQYFKALKAHSLMGFIEGINKLSQTFKPRRKDDFPVPAIISEAIAENLTKAEPEKSRTYEEIQDSYRRRGMLVGDEAKRRLQDEILSDIEAKTGEHIEDKEVFFHGSLPSNKPSTFLKRKKETPKQDDEPILGNEPF